VDVEAVCVLEAIILLEAATIARRNGLVGGSSPLIRIGF
jgi:hypothetical protein